MTTPSSASSTLKSIGPALFSQLVEETDIDDEPPASPEGGAGGPQSEVLPQEGGSCVAASGDLEKVDPEVLKPPTPPLHRFPSWVRAAGSIPDRPVLFPASGHQHLQQKSRLVLQESRIYAVAKSGMRVSEAGPGRGESRETPPLMYGLVLCAEPGWCQLGVGWGVCHGGSDVTSSLCPEALHTCAGGSPSLFL